MSTTSHNTMSLVRRTGLLVLAGAAAAISAIGILTVPAPAQAAPACSQYKFIGDFAIRESYGWQTFFTSYGTSAGGRAVSVRNDTKVKGYVTGGIQGRNIDFTIRLDDGGSEHYVGVVGDDGYAHGTIVGPDSWDSTLRPLGCSDPVAPPPPPPVRVPESDTATLAPKPQPAPPAAPAAARLGVVVNGPTTLPAGLGGTYTVSVSNSGDVSAPVELYVSYGGNLQQSGQVTPAGGFNCEVINNAGGTSAVHCTNPQFQSKATANIVVQGRGSAPGAGNLTVNINSAGAQFVQKSQTLNVSIT